MTIPSDDLAAARDRMLATHVADRGIRDPRILDAMRQVPRERFVAPDMASLAYEDFPLSIGHGQTISQPYIVAAMVEAAEVGADDQVLEVGAGSGYATAVLSRLAAHVCAIERLAALASQARERLAALGYDNVEIVTGDGSAGWPRPRLFDAILVSASGPDVPQPLKRQLAVGGRLVMPVGDDGRQRLVKVRRRGRDDFEQQTAGAVAFVPLVGAHGWSADER
jgi:protein-L-isoaspartate(D-aspartate) O-methyltransferase